MDVTGRHPFSRGPGIARSCMLREIENEAPVCKAERVHQRRLGSGWRSIGSNSRMRGNVIGVSIAHGTNDISIARAPR